ncbi:alpha/beta fold hydrolase [Nocardia stercoris]|uniref:Alpha/beta hydrolase n=1 Tax=Nocardia stercoris TaxID=2483361 RepID=A0A3M2LGQ6_9NOCA|nr:alpha/beta fold hydrolase [Nocardia stercoris]RMI33928.1 alpha/beta hydrolase [Nocardia stercoris]
MSTTTRRFVLVPGAGGVGWYWSRVAAALTEAGHIAIPIDLPGDDTAAGLAEYRDLVLAQATDGDVIVAQSMGAFTAASVCEQLDVAELVLVNAMIPVPGETAGQWWGDVGSIDARIAAADAGGYSREFDPEIYFLHDVPPEIAREGEPFQRPEADRAFGDPCLFTGWPARTRVLAGAGDRFFPLALQQRLARERIGVEPDVVPGGHLVALSNPRAVVDYLLSGD